MDEVPGGPLTVSFHRHDLKSERRLGEALARFHRSVYEEHPEDWDEHGRAFLEIIFNRTTRT